MVLIDFGYDYSQTIITTNSNAIRYGGCPSILQAHIASSGIATCVVASASKLDLLGTIHHNWIGIKL
jgi:hypothetical protein